MPWKCTCESDCDGVLYELRCSSSGCSCTVDGSAGPASTATDCNSPETSLAECGADIEPTDTADMGTSDDTGTACGGVGSSGTQGECSAQVDCDGTSYKLDCDTNAGTCSCTVDGMPGPESTATDCSDPNGALAECGAPV